MTHRKKSQPPRPKQSRQRGTKASAPSAPIPLVSEPNPVAILSEPLPVTSLGDLCMPSKAAPNARQADSATDHQVASFVEPGSAKKVEPRGPGLDPLPADSGRLSVATEGEQTLAPVNASGTDSRIQPLVDEASPTASTFELQLAKRAGAEQIVRDHTTLAAGGGLIPVPGLDLAAIGGLQLRLLAAVAGHYRVPFTRSQVQLIVTSLVGSVGTTVLVGGVLISLAKAIPVFGSLIGAASMPLAGSAITHAIGHLAIDHFEAGGTMEDFDLDLAQRAFAQKVKAAEAALT